MTGNGQIEPSTLAPVPAQLGPFLRADAAAGALLLMAVFLAVHGAPLVIVEAYRDLARQQYLYNGWIRRLPGFNLAAEPGKSKHGWALACDFGSGVNVFGSTHKTWMDKYAPLFGWFPTGNGFDPREAWHYEFRGGAVITNLAQARAYFPGISITSLDDVQEDDMFNDDDRKTVALMAATVKQLQAILATDTVDGTKGGMRGAVMSTLVAAKNTQAAVTSGGDGTLRKAVLDARDATNNLTAIVATDTLKVGSTVVPGGLRGLLASVAAAVQKTAGTPAPSGPTLSTATDAELAAELLKRLEG